jgi:hypothetical protein
MKNIQISGLAIAFAVLVSSPALANLASKTYVDARFDSADNATNVAVVTIENGSPVVKNSKQLADVASSGSYNDLTDTPAAYSLPAATTTVLGGVKLASDVVQQVAAVAATAVADRTYGVQNNAAGQMVVNVPWAGAEYAGVAPIEVSDNSIAHAVSGVSAAAYGPGADAALTSGGTFAVPQVTVNDTGHITFGATRTMTMPTLPDIPAAPGACTEPGATCSLNFGMCTADQNAAGTACAAAGYYWELIVR